MGDDYDDRMYKTHVDRDPKVFFIIRGHYIVYINIKRLFNIFFYALCILAVVITAVPCKPDVLIFVRYFQIIRPCGPPSPLSSHNKYVSVLFVAQYCIDNHSPVLVRLPKYNITITIIILTVLNVLIDKMVMGRSNIIIGIIIMNQFLGTYKTICKHFTWYWKKIVLTSAIKVF